MARTNLQTCGARFNSKGIPYLKSRIFRHIINYDLMVSTSDFWTENLYKKYF